MSANITDSIKEKKQDADELIEIVKKVPRERKAELLAVINGFLLGINTDQKAG